MVFHQTSHHWRIPRDKGNRKKWARRTLNRTWSMAWARPRACTTTRAYWLAVRGNMPPHRVVVISPPRSNAWRTPSPFRSTCPRRSESKWKRTRQWNMMAKSVAAVTSKWLPRVRALRKWTTHSSRPKLKAAVYPNRRFVLYLIKIYNELQNLSESKKKAGWAENCWKTSLKKTILKAILDKNFLKYRKNSFCGRSFIRKN